MGLLNDVVELLKSNIDSDELKKNIMSKKYSSIATRASEGTLQFPILVSNAMDIDTAQMIVKALERNYATFVQTVLSMNSVSSERDIANYLRQFHQNDFSTTNSSEFTADLVKVFSESYQFREFPDGKLLLTETYNNVSTAKIAKDNKNQNVDLMECVRKDILNRKYNPKSPVVYNFKNKNINEKFNSVVTEDFIRLTDAQINRAAHRAGIDLNDADALNAFRRAYINNAHYDYNTTRWEQQQRRNNMKSEAIRNAAQLRLQQDQFEYQKTHDEKNNNFRQAQFDYEKQRNAEMDPAQIAKLNADVAQKSYTINTRELPPQMLKDNDVKKANELVATAMHARIHMINNDGDPIGVQDFMIGIKGTMHPIKSEEMIENMVAAAKNNNKFFNFLRWTTGEISFFKDFWLNINDMKRDVANESKGASRWWIALKNRRALSKIQSSALIKNKILPNATIVLTAEEAEIIKTNYGYDIMHPYFMKKIMNTYYLLGFVVVDNSAQVAHFYFDGSPDFESVSFSGLEKENTRDERKFKEMLKVINRN
jgi:hypothetical protein